MNRKKKRTDKIHISLPIDLISKVTNYSVVNNGGNISGSIAELVTLGFKFLESENNNKETKISKIYSRISYLINLTEQLYSDSNIEFVSDKNKCKSLNDFKKKLRGIDYDD